MAVSTEHWVEITILRQYWRLHMECKIRDQNNSPQKNPNKQGN